MTMLASEIASRAGDQPADSFVGMPTVTIVLPTLMERTFVRDCLSSIAAQDYGAIDEVLVVDGGSQDGTREIVQSLGRPFRLVDNPGVTAASAMNIGIDAARGSIIVRMDAHALYAPDYVRRCVDVLIQTGAANVGGRMRAVGRTAFGRAVAAVTSSKLGVGPGKFHYSDERCDVDTVFLGCWWRRTLVELGGFDVHRLQWAAEDHELNMRIRSSGGRIVLDPTIVSHYFPRETPRALARQYRNYGVGKVSTLAKHRRIPTLRPLGPAGLILATIVGLVAGRGRWRVAVPAAHALVCLEAARRASQQPGVTPHRAFAAVEICHWSYGLGFVTGILRVIRRRPFDTRPRGPR